MPVSHHKIVLNAVYEYGNYGVTCCFCASDKVISNECDKLISGKVLWKEGAWIATKNGGYSFGSKVKT